MGFYSETIFPRLCDFALDRPQVARQRQELLAVATGNVLEIGFGTGLNLPHYPASTGKITIVEPNEGMKRRAERRMTRATIQIDRHNLSSEQLPFGDGEFDCVVSTFTLCSVGAVEQALNEAYRVLKPGGKFLFLEHGLSPHRGVQKWQRRLNWLQMRLGDGCRLDRPMKKLVASQPFSSLDVQEFYLNNTPRTHGYLFRGVATK